MEASNHHILFIKPFLHQQMSRGAYAETQPITPEAQAVQMSKHSG